MEKKQVSTFLKILQIPTNAPPEDIKQSLLDSGWNEADATEAVQILHPDHDGGTASYSPQLVAQKYTPKAPEPTEPKLEKTAPDTAEAKVQPETEATPSSVSVKETKEAPKKIAEEVTSLAKQASVEKTVTATKQSKDHPHADAPWLTNAVDIYDVSEEEKQRMIRTVYRTNERLTPQTIHALLGIDVDLSEYESAYKKEVEQAIGWKQMILIFVLSLIIAGTGVALGLYYFEAGPFHPSITGAK